MQQTRSGCGGQRITRRNQQKDAERNVQTEHHVVGVHFLVGVSQGIDNRIKASRKEQPKQNQDDPERTFSPHVVLLRVETSRIMREGKA